MATEPEIPERLEKVLHAAHKANRPEMFRLTMWVIAASLAVGAVLGVVIASFARGMNSTWFATFGLLGLAAALTAQSIHLMRAQELIRLTTDPPEAT